MPVRLQGSCLCGTAAFGFDSHTPYPYMHCYCTICRRINGGGGYTINIMGAYDSLEVTGREALAEVHAEIDGAQSPMSRTFCTRCGTALWGWHPEWPEIFHPFASAIDTPLPEPPERAHIMMEFKAPWVQPDIQDGDAVFARYPDQSIEDWHKSRNLWID